MKAQRTIVVSLMSVVALASHFYVLRQNFLCYDQGTVRRAILYGDRSCFIKFSVEIFIHRMEK